MIVPGRTTVIEKTGGNFGFGLIVACAELDVPVELAVGLSFSPIKRRLLEAWGAKLIGLDMLNAGASPREVVERQLELGIQDGRHYFYSDQFNNRGSVEAHEFETGPEIVAQLERWPELDAIVFVSCAGTGASLTGVARSLRAVGLEVKVVLVEPEGCNSKHNVFVQHSLEGMSVGVAPPFIDWALVSEIRQVTSRQVDETCKRFARQYGYFVGRTSGACLAVAEALVLECTNRCKVLAMVYDHGLWYEAVST
jgi:cysteine synthase